MLAARLVQAEDKLAFAALGDLLEPVADDLLAELPVPQRRAIAVALLREDPGGRRLDQRAIGAGTATILKVLVRTAAVVVAVDDLQWLDLSSARVLEFALRRLDGLPVAILASQRTGDQSRVPLDLERAVPHGRVTRVEVGPLSMAALHEVIKSRLGRSLPRRMPLRIEQATGGNPFFALEIARSLPEARGPGSPFPPVPDDLAQLVQTRVAGLPAATRTALLAAAALPSPTVELVAGAVQRTRAQALAALERAAAAGIVRLDRSAVGFAHPLFVAAVYACAAPVERRRTHRAPGAAQRRARGARPSPGPGGGDGRRGDRRGARRGRRARPPQGGVRHGRAVGGAGAAADAAGSGRRRPTPDDPGRGVSVRRGRAAAGMGGARGGSRASAGRLVTDPDPAPARRDPLP